MATEQKWVPLMMSGTIIGKTKIDLETGKMESEIDPKIAEFLQEGLEGGVLSISFYGNAAMPISLVHERFQKYLANLDSSQRV